MSGIFDGEGFVARETATHSRIGVSQNPGAVLDSVFKYLDNAEIPYNRTGRQYDACISVTIERRWAAMEVLGRLRPRRLLPQAAAIWEGQTVVGTGPNSVRVIAAEPVGPREVVSLGTSTGTYIANGLVSHNCGRHFNPVTETRTFVPHDIYELAIDDVITVTAFAVDLSGTGIYDQPWVQGTDYQLFHGKLNYNLNSYGAGVPVPYDHVRVINSGKIFPFIYPLSPLNRVQIAGTWGWLTTPPALAEANRILAADLFRMKDAPFGLAGVADFGLTRISANPWLTELLRPFIRTRRKVGV